MQDGTCVFCDKRNFEEDIVGEDENFWFTATLGQISNGGYLLLIPKIHIPCIGAIRWPLYDDLIEAMGKISSVLSQEYGRPYIFEHGIVGQTIKHAHLHFTPEEFSIKE